MLTTNALLCNLRDLVTAMRGLANTLSRMEAQRKIAVTQDGCD